MWCTDTTVVYCTQLCTDTAAEVWLQVRAPTESGFSAAFRGQDKARCGDDTSGVMVVWGARAVVAPSLVLLLAPPARASWGDQSSFYQLCNQKCNRDQCEKVEGGLVNLTVNNC